jgi:Carboxypeptidase regulatory-like domain
MRAVGIAGLLATLAGAAPAPGQQVVRGTVYDSLFPGPMRDAELWVRGTNWRTRTDSSGRFKFDSVVPGTYTVVLSHPGLDSAGLYTLALPLTVRANDTTAIVRFTTSSLATLWARRCGQELTTRTDSGLVFGVVKDAATRAHLDGAGVVLRWLRITQTEATNVTTRELSLTARTDSTGTYYACGVSRDTKVTLRGYAASDSTGLIDLQLGARGVSRQDLIIALAPARRPAVLRGTARTDERTPLIGGRVSVAEGPSTVVEADGRFMLRGVPPGTQWVTVSAIGRTRAGQAVDLLPGDTTRLDVALSRLTVLLAPVRVVARPSRLLEQFEERRRMGQGYGRTEEELAGAGTVRAVLGSLPTVRFGRGPAVTDFVVLLPSPVGHCVATLYIDGFRSDYEQLASYHPRDLAGVEVHPRAITAPTQFQPVSGDCGVVLVWTKYLK